MEPPTILHYGDIPDDLRQVGDDIVLAYKSYTWDRVSGAPVKQEDNDLNELPMAEFKEDLWKIAFSPSNHPAWNPLLPVPNANLPETPKHKDLRIPFGFLIDDARPSTCAVRMNAKSKTKPRVAESRRSGEPVYLQPRPNHRKPDEIEYFWADAAGKGIDFKITSLYAHANPEEIEQAKTEAVQQRDWKVMNHAVAHNRELAAYWMRCRLARAMQQRFPEIPVLQRVSNPTKADFEDLIRPSILRTLVSEEELERIRTKEHAWQHRGKIQQSPHR